MEKPGPRRIDYVFATTKEVHYFGYDERVAGKGANVVAGKGANVVASLLKKMVAMEVARLLGMGGKLKHVSIYFMVCKNCCCRAAGVVVGVVVVVVAHHSFTQ